MPASRRSSSLSIREGHSSPSSPLLLYLLAVFVFPSVSLLYSISATPLALPLLLSSPLIALGIPPKASGLSTVSVELGELRSRLAAVATR